MKKLLISLGVLLMPFVAGAAYNSVTLGTDTVRISVAGVNLTISGSSAVVESITVNTNDFSFVLLPGSYLQVTSTDKLDLRGVSGSSAEFNTDKTCSSSESVTTFSHVDASNTITVTPDVSDACSSGTTNSNIGGSSSGRSGGGGGNSSIAPSPSPTAVAVVATTPAAGKAVFTRLLSVGSTGEDVSNLQTKLKGEGLFDHEVTGYFGPITQKAVKAYQAKYGIDQLGIVGPATRAQLNKVFMANENSNAAATSQLTAAQISTITAQISALLQQVQTLQAKLKALGN